MTPTCSIGKVSSDKSANRGKRLRIWNSLKFLNLQVGQDYPISDKDEKAEVETAKETGWLLDDTNLARG